MSARADRTVVSVSIGSTSRDVDLTMDLLGHRVRLMRRGTGGDLAAARRLVGELDGQVDAIGIGGTDIYVRVAGRKYYFRDTVRIASAAERTPVVCGSGLKDSLERDAVARLNADVGWSGKRVLMVNAVDRFGMAEAMSQHGANVLFGDLIFGLGIDVPIHSLGTLRRAARLALPVLTKLPFKWLYPTGNRQDTPTPRAGLARHYRWADVIAGDWHFIRRHAPADLGGKDVLTNTTTAQDSEFLSKAGVNRLITTTPRIGGRSIGTNLLEAALVAIEGAPGELPPERYAELARQAGLGPTVVPLGGGDRAA